MDEKNKVILTGPTIEIKGSLPRHLIVKKVVNTFIDLRALKIRQTLLSNILLKFCQKIIIFISQDQDSKLLRVQGLIFLWR